MVSEASGWHALIVATSEAVSVCANGRDGIAPFTHLCTEAACVIEAAKRIESFSFNPQCAKDQAIQQAEPGVGCKQHKDHINGITPFR